MKWLPLTVALLSGISGCTSISPSQCKYGDWYAIGQQTATDGLPISTIAKHQNQCVQHGIVPNRNQFVAGYRSVTRNS